MRKWYVIHVQDVWALGNRDSHTSYAVVDETWLASSARERAEVLNDQLEPILDWKVTDEGEIVHTMKFKKEYFVSCTHPEEMTDEEKKELTSGQQY